MARIPQKEIDNRVTAITRLLQEKKHATFKQLAEHLGMKTSSVYQWIRTYDSEPCTWYVDSSGCVSLRPSFPGHELVKRAKDDLSQSEVLLDWLDQEWSDDALQYLEVAIFEVWFSDEDSCSSDLFKLLIQQIRERTSAGIMPATWYFILWSAVDSDSEQITNMIQWLESRTFKLADGLVEELQDELQRRETKTLSTESY